MNQLIAQTGNIVLMPCDDDSLGAVTELILLAKQPKYTLTETAVVKESEIKQFRIWCDVKALKSLCVCILQLAKEGERLERRAKLELENKDPE